MDEWWLLKNDEIFIFVKSIHWTVQVTYKKKTDWQWQYLLYLMYYTCTIFLPDVTHFVIFMSTILFMCYFYNVLNTSISLYEAQHERGNEIFTNWLLAKNKTVYYTHLQFIQGKLLLPCTSSILLCVTEILAHPVLLYHTFEYFYFILTNLSIIVSYVVIYNFLTPIEVILVFIFFF